MPQRSLFDDSSAPWELDDAELHRVATVVFPKGPHGEFDYLVPSPLLESLVAGSRVRVPLGRSNRAIVGYAVKVESRTLGSRRLKPVSSLVDDRPLLTPAMLQLTHWIADRYLCDWGQVLEGVVPVGVRKQSGTRSNTYLTLAEGVAENLPQLTVSPKQRQALEFLLECGEALTMQQLAEAVGISTAPIAALKKKGLLSTDTRRTFVADRPQAGIADEQPLVLNADQQKAWQAIQAALDSAQHQTLLLHGVTGSGKTEVYLQAISHLRQFGRQAIVLVPEISLTPQTVRRFQSRLGNVAVLHSHLSDTDRHAYWQQIAAGEVSVVVGARSAIFAPTPHLGLIVLDEEHEASFKQESAPRYHARDVAQYRAQHEGVPLILGTATPSLESWHQVERGTAQRLSLPTRVLGRPLPTVRTVDLRETHGSRLSQGAISRPLAIAMQEVLKRDEQVILLLNRRGYSTHIQCPACGEVVRCPSCDIALTHHRKEEIALCHYCDYEVPAPTHCPGCQFVGIRYSGLGTQRLEAEIRARFPDYPALRMDTDSMQRPGSHEVALNAFRRGEVKILMGTQMIAKGLDFPNVTLVGVVNADTSLHLPDFRAAERTCQLLVQVAGRSGRSELGGRVLIQTFAPEHPALQAAVTHNYEGFIAGETPLRRALQYPPFASMIRLVVRGPKEPQALEFAKHLVQRTEAAAAERKLTDAIRVLGPAPCPLPKLRDMYRFHIQLQAADGPALRDIVRAASAGLKPPDDLQWIADVDPWSMM